MRTHDTGPTADGVTIVHAGPDATVRLLTRDAMLAERAELLAGTTLTEEQLRAAGAAWELDAHHRGVLMRIDGLDFLLTHTPPTD